MLVGDWVEVECGWRRVEQVYRGRAYIRVVHDGSKTGYRPREILNHRDARLIIEGDEVIYNSMVYAISKIVKSPSGSMADLVAGPTVRLSECSLHRPIDAIPKPFSVSQLIDALAEKLEGESLETEFIHIAELQLRILEP